MPLFASHRRKQSRAGGIALEVTLRARQSRADRDSSDPYPIPRLPPPTYRRGIHEKKKTISSVQPSRGRGKGGVLSSEASPRRSLWDLGQFRAAQGAEVDKTQWHLVTSTISGGWVMLRVSAHYIAGSQLYCSALDIGTLHGQPRWRAPIAPPCADTGGVGDRDPNVKNKKTLKLKAINRTSLARQPPAANDMTICPRLHRPKGKKKKGFPRERQ